MMNYMMNCLILDKIVILFVTKYWILKFVFNRSKWLVRSFYLVSLI